MKDVSEIEKSIITMLRRLKIVPLDEVHANIDACIAVFEEGLQSSGQKG